MVMAVDLYIASEVKLYILKRPTHGSIQLKVVYLYTCTHHLLVYMYFKARGDPHMSLQE